MKNKFIKTAAMVIVISGVSTSCISLAGDNSVFHENGVEIIIKDKISLIPHGSGDDVLQVAGHSFHNLNSPSYVFVPEWNSIIFLTHREGGAYILHIFSLEKRRDTAIKQDGFYFGGGLGRLKANNDASFVEKVEGDTAVLVDRRYGGMDNAFEDTYQLDRSKKTVSHLEKRKRVDKP